MPKPQPLAKPKGKERPVFAYNEAGQPICGAHSKRSGKPCQQTRLNDNGRCRMHGGGSAKGPDAGRFKTGSHSRYAEYQALGIAEIILEKGEQLKNTTHTDEIEFLGALWCQEARQALPLLPMWQEALDLWNAAMAADVEALKRLGPVLSNGLDQAKRREHLVKLAGEQMKHKQAQHRQDYDKQVAISVAAFLAHNERVASLIESVITDKEQRTTLAGELRKLGFIPSDYAARRN